jgi:hypothetical protein
MTDPEPLWLLMSDAYGSAPRTDYGSDRFGYAAELRVIAASIEDHFILLSGDAVLIRDWLLAEADRAEDGS